MGRTGRNFRTKWRISKATGSPLFDIPVAEYDVNKTTLCYWCDFYDSIYENPDCPSESILNDFKATDKWLNEQIEKVKSSRNNNNRNTRNPSGHQETIIFDIDYDEDGGGM